MATDVIQLAEKSWDEAVPQGKEVDCIYGDWVLRNKHIVAVIAEALPKAQRQHDGAQRRRRGDRPDGARPAS